jgi:hypothetical protein
LPRAGYASGIKDQAKRKRSPSNRPASDALKLDAGLHFLLTKKAAIAAAFTGEFSEHA